MDDMHTHPEGIIVDFTFLDETFQDEPERLAKVLEMIYTELNASEDLMMEALRNRHEQSFRDIKHKLLPSLSYLKVPGMRDMLEQAKKDLIEKPDTFDNTRYMKGLALYYKSIKVAVSGKIASMKGH